VLYLLVDGLYEGEDVPGRECLLLLHLQQDPCTVLVLYLLVDGLYEGEDVPRWECLLLLHLQQDDNLVLSHAGQAAGSEVPNKLPHGGVVHALQI